MKKCRLCNAPIVDGARYCYMCGSDLKIAENEAREKQLSGEIPMYSCTFSTPTGEKTLEVWCHDITNFPIKIDLMTISAYRRNYDALFTHTMMGALHHENGIDIKYYAQNAFMDLQDAMGCWISQPVIHSENNKNIGRLGCIEFSGKNTTEDELLLRIKAYCHLLDLAADLGVEMDTVGMPIVGTGNQKIPMNKIIIPLINEVVSLLMRNSSVNRLIFIERNYEKAHELTDTLEKSYQMISRENNRNDTKQLRDPYVFVSYSNNGDKYTAELLCRILSEKKISYFFAPEDIESGIYSSNIVQAIDKCTHFICIISEKSMDSFHMLNELNLAFEHMKDGIMILPFRMDESELSASFKYYLSTMKWNYGYPAPLESKIRAFIDKMFLD